MIPLLVILGVPALMVALPCGAVALFMGKDAAAEIFKPFAMVAGLFVLVAAAGYLNGLG